MNLPALSAVYEQYEILSQLRDGRFSGSLAGKLLLRSGLDENGVAVLVAAGIAGACSLCVEPDAETLREAMRAGLCDFVVGPLDEALRILKNELRRGRAVSVGLASARDSALAEIIDRGLQPDLVSSMPNETSGIFVERGAVVLPAHDASEPGTALIEWTLSADIVRSMAKIGRIAAENLDAQRPDTPRRQHWLESAPRRLGRAFAARHCVRMTPAESAAFAAAAREQFPAVRLTRDGAEL